MLLLFIFLVLPSEICQVTGDAKNISSVIQYKQVVRAEVGNTATLECFCESNAVTFLFWYQQSLGGKLRIISSRMEHKQSADIDPAFKERFEVTAQNQNQKRGNHLTITNLRLSDSANYFCGILEFNAIEFGEGTFLHVKAPQTNLHTVIHQPALVPLQSGDSVNLGCAVYTESLCAGEKSLYWFRHGDSKPTVTDPSARQCMSLPNEKTHVTNCTANLAIKSVKANDAGMYYCALASCGEIVFGNGTRVEIEDTSTQVDPLLVCCLSVALAVSIIVLLVLAFIMYKLKKKLCSVCKGIVSHETCSASSNTKSQDADTLHYAALSLKRNTNQHRQEDNMESVCVYSGVKSPKE